MPRSDDLPGAGWMALDDGAVASGGVGPGELMDCLGPGFPDAAVVGSASSPHFVRPPSTLVHGVGIELTGASEAVEAQGVLAGAEFARCLGRSIAADLDASGSTELLGVQVEPGAVGHRVRFTGGDERGVRPVNLDVACLRVDRAVVVLWCGDTPAPFPPDDLASLVEAIRRRVSA